MQESNRVESERENARRWAVRLEGELARAQEAMRSEEILRERAEDDRDTALGRLASCGSEVSAFRQQRDQARAERDEAFTAIATLIDTFARDAGPDAFGAALLRAGRLAAHYRPSATGGPT